jgi:pimeloyl-ACP methyl ester carboxylesterase
MQPHRVKRFLLDGVASSSQYYGGLITSDNKQADATYERFFEYCALAGPDNCTMWAGNSSADTQRLYQSILDNINDEGPIPVTGSVGPALIHLSDILTYGSNMLYTPDQFFSIFADAIAPLAERNGTLLANLLPSSVATLADYFDPYDPNTYVVFDGYPQNAIVGADATGVRYNTSAAYEHVWHELQNVTRWTGNLTAAEYLAQFSWPSNPKWQYGPAKPISSNATAAPILFASNLIDGVTSLQSAQEMHAAFPSSGLLLNDGQGHTTASSPGLELAKKFRYYFQTGELPWNLSTPTLPYSRPLLGTDGPRIAPFNSTNATLEDQALFNASIGLD